MLKRYEINLLETGGALPPGPASFKVSAEDIEGAAIRASYELGQDKADLIKLLDKYAYVSWADRSIFCEIVEIE